MKNSDVPRCPKGILETILKSGDGSPDAAGQDPDPATIWEVANPTGELFIVLVVERFDAEEAAPFAFVRGVPLTDFVRLVDIGDVVITIDSDDQIFAAHCWLEGPILCESLRRCIGRALPASMSAVAEVRGGQRVQTANSAVALFRESLYEQFDPIFSASWEKLNSVLDDADSDESVDVVRLGPGVDGLPSAQIAAEQSQFYLAAGGNEISLAIIDRLASVSVGDVPNVNLRRAWAHFLASTYSGTSCREEWLTKFVELASKQDSSLPDWKARSLKAEAIMRQRDWKRRYLGEKVFALEPVAVKNMQEFLNLLSDLVDLSTED